MNSTDSPIGIDKRQEEVMLSLRNEDLRTHSRHFAGSTYTLLLQMSLYFPVVRQLAWVASVQTSLFLALILRELLGVCPELADGHIKIIANRSHYVTRGVRETALYSSQIIGAIAKRCR